MLQLPWGGDMRWQNASYYYGNMSVLIKHVNANPAEYGMHIRWATPSEYFDALHAATETHSFPLLEVMIAAFFKKYKRKKKACPR